MRIGVGVNADADGTGRVRATVTLDRDAARRVPDLADQLRVDDLVKAGWRVDPPAKRKNGAVVVVATKAFRNPAEMSRVVRELNEPTGPFRDFELRRQGSFLKTKTEFTGTVDLSRGIAAFSDPQLDEQLGDGTFGVDPAALERQAKATLDRVFAVEVAARLPGDVTSNSALNASNGAVWRPKFGEKAQLHASASQWNVRRIAAAAVCVVALVALVFVLRQRSRVRVVRPE